MPDNNGLHLTALSAPPGQARRRRFVLADARTSVFVQRWRRFVAEEGIFIAFAGVSVNIQAGQDPYFSPIADRLFWYRIKG